MVKILDVKIHTMDFNIQFPSHPAKKTFKINELDEPSLDLAQGSIYRFDQSDPSNINYQIKFFTTKKKELEKNVKIEGIPGHEGAYTELYIDNKDQLNINYQSDNLIGNTINFPYTSQNDYFKIGEGSIVIDACAGIDTAVFKNSYEDYSFKNINNQLLVKDIKTSPNKKVIALQNVELLKFSDQIVEKENLNKTKSYRKNFNDYEFIQDSNNNIFVKLSNTFDDITGIPKINFAEKSISAIRDISGTFDLITGKEEASGEIFRLHKAAFKRHPDVEGLKYWIKMYKENQITKRQIAKSFLESDEYITRFKDSNSDAKFVNNLYQNVLGRLPDNEGFQYWFNQLDSGRETKSDLLLGFAESSENKALFSEMTGIF